MKKKLQKLGIILGIMSIFGNNKKHNDKVLKEFRNRIMMKILSIIPTSLLMLKSLINLVIVPPVPVQFTENMNCVRSVHTKLTYMNLNRVPLLL